LDLSFALFVVATLFIFFFLFYLMFTLKKELVTTKELLMDSEDKCTDLLHVNAILETNNAVIESQLESSSVHYKEKIELLNDAKNRLSEQFELLSHQIFEKRSQSFDEINQKNMQLLLKPFREQIDRFSKESKDRYIHESQERHLLKDEILRLKTLNETISRDAINLTNALKGENKTQGNWGEVILEKILEDSGLRENHEFVREKSLHNSELKRYRPDVIVHLPRDKDIIIDSKVSLKAYNRYINEEDTLLKASFLKEHLHSLNVHVKSLSSKKYEELEGVKTLDFILLFMPIEGAFLLALEKDGEFFSKAYDQNIIVVSPSTLLVTLRTIEHIWRSERQELHAQEIATKAENLYDKFVLFTEDMKKIGSHIDKTQEVYESAMNKLHVGKGNLVKRSEDMRKLGLKPKKLLDSRLIGDDDVI